MAPLRHNIVMIYFSFEPQTCFIPLTSNFQLRSSHTLDVFAKHDCGETDAALDVTYKGTNLRTALNFQLRPENLTQISLCVFDTAKYKILRIIKFII